MLRIGDVRLGSNLLLAPIAGYCDLAFRTVCRRLGGVGLACTDLLSPDGLLRGTARSLDLASTNSEDKPIGMQLYGADPGIMADGARWALDNGATVIDINMGCPVDKVVKKNGGSKLMCDFDHAGRISEAILDAVGGRVPVTAKMRLGWSRPDDAPRLAVRLAQLGIDGVTVHGRTTEQRFRGSVDRAAIHDVVRAVHGATGGRVPVIANGDVRTAQDAADTLEETGADGVMIGRGALAAPWIFRDAHALLTSGSLPDAPSDGEIVEATRTYFRLMLEYRGEHSAMHQIRQRISWLSKPLASPARSVKPYKEAVRLAPDPAAVEHALDAFLEGDLQVRHNAREPEAPEAPATTAA